MQHRSILSFKIFKIKKLLIFLVIRVGITMWLRTDEMIPRKKLIFTKIILRSYWWSTKKNVDYQILGVVTTMGNPDLFRE